MVTKTRISNLLDAEQFPELVTARNRLARVQQSRAEHDLAIRELNRQLTGSSVTDHGEKSLAQAAEKFIAGGDLLTPADISQTTREAIAEKFRQGQVLNEALVLAERQVDEARSTAGKALAERLEPEYRAILGRMKAALVALRVAGMEEVALRDKVADAGFSATFGSYLRAMPYPGLGYCEAGGDNDVAGIADLWLAELATYFPTV